MNSVLKQGDENRKKIDERIAVRREIEDEVHLLLDCVSYELLRRRMFRSIRLQTGGWYHLAAMREDREWMIEALLGAGVLHLEHRKIMRVAVSRYLYKALKLRARYLNQDS